MKRSRVGYALLGTLLLAAVAILSKWYMDDCGDIGTCSLSKWKNPNFSFINVASYNYTDYDIYGPRTQRSRSAMNCPN